jgi:arsenite methyltransferase
VQPRRGDYGFDAPYVPLLLGVGGVITAALGAFGGGVLWWISSTWFFLSAASYVYTTRAGKFQCWAEQIGALSLQGDERILDVGCGRGAVLLMCAQRLDKGGRAIGLDLWSTTDQSGNDPNTTRANAKAEGVEERIELVTGDMCEMPFEDVSFDVVVSSLAIHNVPSAEGRDKAVREIARVLRPGGRALLADFRHARAYEETLRNAGFTDVQRRSLGWRFWYGGPHASTALVTGRKPG